MNSPSTPADSFERVAQLVVDRVGGLLRTWVCVVDERNFVVSASEPAAVGLPLVHVERPGWLQVPLRLVGRLGRVIVEPPTGGDPIAPHLAQVLVELLIHQIVMSQLPNQHELKHKFIYDLLCGQAGDEETVLRSAQVLGLDLLRPRSVLLLDAGEFILSAPGAGQSWQRVQRVIASIVSFFHLPTDTICGYIGNGEVAVLKAASRQDLSAWSTGSEAPNPSWADLDALKRAGAGLLDRLRHDTGTSIGIGIGRYHPHLGGLARSYQDARAALTLGRRFHGPNRVHCLDGLGVAAFVGITDEPTKLDLARHLLSPLDGEPELLETLRAFFQHNCCPSSTATALSIHRNTLSYRLDKIASFAGLDPRRFDDAIQIRLALLLRTLASELPERAQCPTLTRRLRRVEPARIKHLW